MAGLACGIDFGTSNSLAAVAIDGEVRLCDVDPENIDPQLLPSLIYFSRYHWKAVGRAATHAYQDDPEGRFVRALKGALPDLGPDDTLRMMQETHTLSSLAALLLTRIRERLNAAYAARHGEVTRVTLGRPVRFSPDPAIDRRAEGMLRHAAELAGFREIRFLTEPEAATKYFLSGNSLSEVRQGAEASGRSAPPPGTRRNVMIFDFGGGTLDLCVARVSDATAAGASAYEVLNTGGASIGGTLLDRILFERKLLKHLGQGQTWGRGLSLPNALFNRLVNPDANWRITELEYAREVRQILNATMASGRSALGIKALYSIVARRRGPDLFNAIEAAKMRLSDEEATSIAYRDGEVSIEEPLTRADLRVLFREELDAIRALVRDTLDAVRLAPADIDHVLLAGGSSALVCIQELLGELFGEERVPARQDLYTSIVRGLALDAAA